MTKAVKVSSAANTLAKLKTLFGPPPVLGSEDPKAYDEMLLQALVDIQPRNFIAEMLAKSLADAMWEAKRYLRFKNLAVERQYREQQEMNGELEEGAEGEQSEESMPTDEQQEPAAKPAEADEQLAQVEEIEEPGPLSERSFELEAAADVALSECKAIIQGPVEELEYAAAFDATITHYERLDRLYAVAMARIEDVLKLLDLYEQGLGSRLRRVANDIIDGEFRETTEEPVSIQGPDGAAQ